MEENKVDIVKVNNNLECRICEKLFNSKAGLRKHSFTHITPCYVKLYRFRVKNEKAVFF